MEVLGSLSQLGPTGAVLIILIYVTWSWYKSDKRYAAELSRVNLDHDNELREIKESLAEAREELRALRAEIQEERRFRMKAEEDAHKLRLKERRTHDQAN